MRERHTRQTSFPEWIAVVVILAMVTLMSLPNLRSTNIDDLDSAHHLMDGYFFYDLMHDRPHSHMQQYVLQYHKQYPALGFLFWPPLVPFVLGVFDMAFGPNVQTARLCILFFGAVFALGFYAILRREVSFWVASAAACAVVGVPGVFWSFNQVMLELPTLAFMCLAVLATYHVIDKAESPTSYSRALLCAAACAAVIYAKQPGWFLYPALILVALQRKTLFRKAEPYVVMGLMVVFCLPLLLFTLKFGHANLAQSVGNDTRLIMPTYESIPRWSFAAWSYYPKYAWSLLNPVVLLLGLGGLGLSLRREFRQRHLLWIAWFCFAYLTFSFYDNRVGRHATFWWPAWVALAAACVQEMTNRLPTRAARLLPALLVLPLVWQLPKELRQGYSDFRGERPIVAALYTGGDPGNVLLFGPDKQTFIAMIREYDVHRKDSAVRGERLVADGGSLSDVCRRYRIREVLVELAPGDDMGRHPELSGLTASPLFSEVAQDSYERRGQTLPVLVFHYSGPIDATMAEIPLSDKLL